MRVSERRAENRIFSSWDGSVWEGVHTVARTYTVHLAPYDAGPFCHQPRKMAVRTRAGRWEIGIQPIAALRVIKSSRSRLMSTANGNKLDSQTVNVRGFIKARKAVGAANGPVSGL